MKFKQLRPLIYSLCEVICGIDHEFIDTYEPSRFDDCTVIGVRVRWSHRLDEEYVEVNLKK